MNEAAVKSMPDRAFLSYLVALDVQLEIDGDRLRCNAPEGVLTDPLKTELVRRKSEILELLRNPVTSPAESFSDSPGRYNLSPVQQRLWQLASRRSTTEMHHIATAFRLRGPLDVEALEKSLQWIQQRHSILRTVFVSNASEPSAVVRESMPVAPHFVELQNYAEEERQDRMWESIHEAMRRSFDLSTGPLWRASVFSMDENDHVLLFVMHHIVFDGWSKNVLIKDIEESYRTFTEDGEPPAGVSPVQYADYASWQRNWLRSSAATEQLSYWEHTLSGFVPELRLPTTRSRPEEQKFLCGSHSFEIPEHLFQALSTFSRKHKVSLFITLLAGFNVTLNRYTSQEDLIICTPVHGRSRTEWERVIGCFNNIVVMRSDLSDDPTLDAVLARTREVVLGAYRHQDIPIQVISAFPNLVRTTLTRAMFSLRNARFHTMSLPRIDVERIEVRKRTADFDLAAYMEQGPDGLRGTMEYNMDVFDPDAVVEFTASYLQNLETLANHPDSRLSQLPKPRTRTLVDVEEALRAHPQVEEAAVLDAVLEKEHEESRVVAYIVANQYDIPSHHGLREYLMRSFPEHLVPSVFVPVDGLPLNESGQVDHAALPMPPADLRVTDYIAPRTDLERKLVEIWTRVLWLDEEIGVRDNFFDLGGHSLLSAQLFCEIEDALGQRLTSQTFHQLTTVEDLARFLEEDAVSSDGGARETGDPVSPRVAALLQGSGLESGIYQGLLAHVSGWKGERPAPDSLVFGLNTNGSKQSLFWCCQGFRELSQLAIYLGADQPVYGMRSGHRLMERTDENEEALAAYYAGEILAMQPCGPFLLGGNCQAGIIAFKIAKRLLALGHQVMLLCLQERFIPEHYPGRIVLLYGRDSTRSPLHYLNQSPETWKKFYTGPMSVHFIDGRHGEFFREPNINTLAGKLSTEIELAKQSFKDAPQVEVPVAKLPETACRASISSIREVTSRPGESFRLRVRVGNESAQNWPGGAVTLGYRLKDPGGRFDITTDPGKPLPEALEPGCHADTDVLVTAPGKKGVYRVELDLLDGGIFWFRSRGSKPARVILIVRWNSKLANVIWDSLRRFRDLMSGK